VKSNGRNQEMKRLKDQNHNICHVDITKMNASKEAKCKTNESRKLIP
jgi:hypothetical protein